MGPIHIFVVGDIWGKPRFCLRPSTLNQLDVNKQSIISRLDFSKISRIFREISNSRNYSREIREIQEN
jgi:hypothetical protein